MNLNTFEDDVLKEVLDKLAPGFDKVVDKVYRKALAMSNGPRRKPGAYSTRKTTSPYDPPKIAIRSGEFIQAWRTSISRTADELQGAITNDCRYAGFLAGGTRKMRARQIDLFLEKYAEVELTKEFK